MSPRTGRAARKRRADRRTRAARTGGRRVGRGQVGRGALSRGARGSPSQQEQIVHGAHHQQPADHRQEDHQRWLRQREETSLRLLRERARTGRPGPGGAAAALGRPGRGYQRSTRSHRPGPCPRPGRRRPGPGRLGGCRGRCHGRCHGHRRLRRGTGGRRRTWGRHGRLARLSRRFGAAGGVEPRTRLRVAWRRLVRGPDGVLAGNRVGVRAMGGGRGLGCPRRRGAERLGDGGPRAGCGSAPFSRSGCVGAHRTGGGGSGVVPDGAVVPEDRVGLVVRGRAGAGGAAVRGVEHLAQMMTQRRTPARSTRPYWAGVRRNPRPHAETCQLAASRPPIC